MKVYRRYMNTSKMLRAIERKKRLNKYKNRDYYNKDFLMFKKNKENKDTINSFGFLFPCTY